jgi:hypothetical protein
VREEWEVRGEGEGVIGEGKGEVSGEGEGGDMEGG